MENCGFGKFLLGLLAGAAAGAAAVYLSDKEKRERLSENISTGVDKTRDTLVEKYYEAKSKYEELRARLSQEAEDLIESAKEEINEEL